MKKINVFLTLCCLLALVACQKKNAPLFRGDYSFKTSGSVTLDEIDPEDEPTTYTVSLPNAKLRISMAETALADAEANLKVTEDYYEAGLVALSDLLEAQTLLKQSRDELTDSRVEYRINLVTYRQLTKD